MNFITLFLSVLAAVNALAQEHHMIPHMHHHVDVTRFSRADCAKGSAYGLIHNIKVGSCYSFKHGDKLAGMAARISHNHDNKIGYDTDCRLHVYDEEDCKGRSVASQDIWKHNGKCFATENVQAGSAKLKCWRMDTHEELVDEGGRVMVADHDVVTTVVTAAPAATTVHQVQPAEIPDTTLVTKHTRVLVVANPGQEETMPVVMVTAIETGRSQVITTSHHHAAHHEPLTAVAVLVPSTDQQSVVTKTVTTTMGLAEFLERQTGTAPFMLPAQPTV